MSALEDLIAKLEAATGPDRSLDAEIVWHLTPGVIGIERGPPDGFGLDYLFVFDPPRRWMDSWLPVPNYTESLDAAQTLKPPSSKDVRVGLTIWVHPSGKGEAILWSRIRDPKAEGGWAVGSVAGNPGLPANIGANPAIAICIACLKARIAK